MNMFAKKNTPETWSDIEKAIFTPEEIAESDKRVAAMSAGIDAKKAQAFENMLRNKEKAMFEELLNRTAEQPVLLRTAQPRETL